MASLPAFPSPDPYLRVCIYYLVALSSASHECHVGSGSIGAQTQKSPARFFARFSGDTAVNATHRDCRGPYVGGSSVEHQCSWIEWRPSTRVSIGPLSCRTKTTIHKAKMRSLALAAALAVPTEAFSPVNLSQPRMGRRSAANAPLNAEVPTQSNFLTPELAQTCSDAAGGTPLYAYSLDALAKSADACLAFPNAYGLTVRYAMKSSPNGSILKYFLSRGISIDASSGYEVRRAIDMGVPAENISLSSQELPGDFDELIKMGVKINAWLVSSNQSPP